MSKKHFFGGEDVVQKKNGGVILWGVFGGYRGGDVTNQILVQYNAVQPCSIVQVRHAVSWYPKKQNKNVKYKENHMYKNFIHLKQNL